MLLKSGADSDLLFIAADNKIGLGTDAPNAEFHVSESGASATKFVIEKPNATTQAVQIRLKSDSSNNRPILNELEAL